MVDVLLLAGSPNDGQLQNCSPATQEALIELNGQIMLNYVWKALKAVSELGKIVIIGSEDLKPFLPPDAVLVENGADLLQSARNGLAEVSDSQEVLVATSDIPLITPEAIQDFLQLCRQKEADLFYSAVRQETILAKYPQSKRTFVKLKDGVFTGGNLILLRPASLEKCWHIGGKLLEARKNPLALGNIIGKGFLIKLMLGRVSLSEAEKKVSEVLQVKGTVIISSYPEIGVDVDKPEDLAMVEELLA